MRTLVATILLLLALPTWAAAPAGCGPLCGRWTLDQSRSDSAEATLDAALARYKEPRPKRTGRSSNDPVGAIVDDMERSLGPVLDRPRGQDLRNDLLPKLAPPAELAFDSRGREVLLRASGQSERRLSIGQPHARVDVEGTAKIESRWNGSTLSVSERYDRRRQHTESYALQRDGSLLVTRVLRRPGLDEIRVRSVYRRE